MDETEPYRVGSAFRDASSLQNSPVSHVPLSPFACWPRYDKCGPFVDVVTSHNHCTVLNKNGELWGWGNGTDGRVGVERFLNMSGETKNGKTGKAKPAAMDRCKCIMMGPHRVGVGRPEYWPGGLSLTNYRVLKVATGRNHMACIAVLRGGGGSKSKQAEEMPRQPWLPLGERVGRINDAMPPVLSSWSP